MEGVSVLVRIIEAPPGIAPLIARSTNSQNPIKSEDFRANDDRQLRLRKEFDLLSPPWFYEHKRGLWTFEHRDADSRRQYLSGVHAPRYIGIKDVAQASLAFLGSPAEAVDRTRLTFTTDDRYDRVFPQNILAGQLLLPILLYRKADEAANRAKPRYQWAPYLRYPVVSCVSRLLHEFLAEPSGGYLSKAASETLSARIDDWGEIVQKAFDILLFEVEELTTQGTGARSLVRQSGWIERPYQQFRQAIRERVDSEDKIAKQLSKDPRELGFRASFPYPLRGLD